MGEVIVINQLMKILLYHQNSNLIALPIKEANQRFDSKFIDWKILIKKCHYSFHKNKGKNLLKCLN
jgi:hypothetical protein